MTSTFPHGKTMRFNPPPNWPAIPPGWVPPPGWAPDPSWPPPPEGWQLWIEDGGIAGVPSGGTPGATTHTPGRPPRWMLVVGAGIIGLVIARLTPGVAGHVLAFLVWAAAAWACLLPARGRVASAARTWARVGVAACACLALYAATLAIMSAGGSAGSGGGGSCDLSVTNIQWANASQISVAAQYASCDNTANAIQDYMDSVNSSAGNAGGYNVVPGNAGGSVQCQFTIEGDPVTVYAPDSAGLCSIFGG